MRPRRSPVPQTLDRRAAWNSIASSPKACSCNDKEIFLGALSAGRRQPGFQVLTPLRLADGRIVFVNRGFIPAELKDPAKRAAGQIAGTVRVSGLLRLPPAGSRAGLCRTIVPT